MARRYAINFPPILTPTVRDLISIINPIPVNMVRLLRVWFMCGNLGAIVAQNIQFLLARFTAPVVLGTGGAAAGLTSVDGGNPAAGTTARINDFTTQMTGAAQTYTESRECFVTQGIDVVFSDPPTIATQQGFVIRLNAATTGGVLLGGGVLLEEIGGIG